jgi:outer membrane protein assembly factor BamB
MNRVITSAIILGLAGSCFAATPLGFRGDGSVLYPEANPALHWSVTNNVVWKTAFTNWSNASPLLVGDLIFTCAEPASLICLSAKDGSILWQDAITNIPSMAPETHADNGYTSATPCSDGKKIWMVFGQGVVACWDISGKKVWETFLEVPPHKKWGSCISPRLAGDVLAVQFENLYGLDPNTGVTKWKVKTGWKWGTPVVAKISGKDILYTCKGKAFDAASGQEFPEQGLPALDFNSPCLVNGVLYYIYDKPKAFTLPSSLSDKPAPLWPEIKLDESKARYYATPVIHDGLVYAINEKGLFYVLDQATGSVVFTNKFNFDITYQSPTLAGDYVFLSCEKGITAVVKTGRTYEFVALNNLEKFRACPVFSGTRMYIRTLKHLWCIGR